MGTGLCNQRCKECKYHVFLTSSGAHDVGCYYLVFKGTARPCPAGEGCTVFEKGKPLDVKRRYTPPTPKMKKCAICGKEFPATKCKRYCDGCAKAKQEALHIEYNKQRREERAANELSKPKSCIICGTIYYSERTNTGFCPECKALKKYDREKKRRLYGKR